MTARYAYLFRVRTREWYTVAVSYTHLDVYKRQIRERDLEREAERALREKEKLD